MAVSVPQTSSIALGAAFSTLVDSRILVLVMTAVVLAFAAPLARAPRDEEHGRVEEPVTGSASL
jgi:hypothetical protein